MGQYAEDIIDGTCDWSGDYTYKDNQKEHKYYPETQAEKDIRRIRKELATLIKNKIADNPNTNENVLVNEARREINQKYGKGWRERGLISNSDNQWRPLNEYPI